MMTDASSNGSFVSICCDSDRVYPPISNCYRNGSDFDGNITFPPIYDSNFSISTISSIGFVRVYDFFCDGWTYDLDWYSPQNDLFYMMENGSIYVNKTIDYGEDYDEDDGEDYWLGTEDYCLDSRSTENGTRNVVSVCRPFMDLGLTLDELLPDKIFYPITISLSLVFLAATFLVYTILPELKNIFGSILRVYVACLFAFYTLILIIHASPGFLCTHFTGVLIFFLAETIVFWQNVMSFDIWWTFRRFKGLQGTSMQEGRKKFIIYSIYAWGNATLSTVVSWMMEDTPDESTMGFGLGLNTSHCSLMGFFSHMLWLFFSVTLVIICNTCFFVSTTVTLICHSWKTHHLRSRDSRRINDAKQSFHLHLKLFIVMGVTWLGQYILYIFTNLDPYVEFLVDLPNLLQGVIIFVIFVWKDRIKQLLRERLGFKGSCLRSRNSTNRACLQSSPNSSTKSTCVTTNL